MHTPRTESPVDEKRWFYVDARKEPVGPISFSELKRLHRWGRISMSTYVIQEGGEKWKLLAQLPPAELAAIKERSWKWTNRLPVVLLLFSLPPLGLYLLWKSERFPRRAQWMLTVVGAFFTLGALPLPSSDDHRAAPTRSKAAATPTPRREPPRAKPEQLATAPKQAESLFAEMEALLGKC